MTIPQYSELFPLVLQLLQDGRIRKISEIRADVASKLQLTKQQLEELLPSKTQPVFNNRCQWSAYYLRRAGILESPKKGHYKLSDRGSQWIAKNGYNITLEDLKQYKEFLEFIKPTTEGPEEIEEETPEDLIEKAHLQLQDQLADELLSEIMEMSPSFFENLVLDLLLQMGYGGKTKNAGSLTSYLNDEGIDGTIKEDELGLDTIYLQAKRWKYTVTRPEIQKFLGALVSSNATKGVFITTSAFSDGAEETVKKHSNYRIVLIDGKELTRLMMLHEVGLTKQHEYRILRIDRDYFTENEG